MAPLASPEQRVDLLGTVQVLHEHLTTSLCQTVFQQTRTTERERRWSLAALASFWTEVILTSCKNFEICRIGSVAAIIYGFKELLTLILGQPPSTRAAASWPA